MMGWRDKEELKAAPTFWLRQLGLGDVINQIQKTGGRKELRRKWRLMYQMVLIQALELLLSSTGGTFDW